MGTEIIHAELPSRHFEPRIYDAGAWTDHLQFAYDLVATMQPRVLVELGVDRGESQWAAENKTGTRCFGVDTWHGDQHAGGYHETTFREVSAHNRAHYERFQRCCATGSTKHLQHFAPESIDKICPCAIAKFFSQGRRP